MLLSDSLNMNVSGFKIVLGFEQCFICVDCSIINLGISKVSPEKT